MSYLDSDPTKPTQDLLTDIRAATQQPHFPGLPLLPFANLLVKVSTEASEAIEGLKAHITDLNEKNAKLQWWVVALAVAALISAVVQTTIAVVAYISPPPNAQQTASIKSSSVAAQTPLPPALVSSVRAVSSPIAQTAKAKPK